MKKYKLYPTNSFYYYQQRKKRKKKLFTIMIIVGFVLSAFLWMKASGFFIHQGRHHIESVYLSTPGTNYELFHKAEEVKGIYIPSSKIQDYEEYISLAKETGINAFVIDVKNDKGYLTFATDDQMLTEAGVILAKPPISDIKHMMNRFYEEGIYPIARVVAFKDNVIPNRYPNRAVKSIDGQVFVTRGGDMWLDPYNKENWSYLLTICDEALKLGFKEIQFDYIRFHESMDEDRVVLNQTVSKQDIITAFTKYACKHLHREGAFVSADVFGAIILSDLDASIVGQDFAEMSKYLDYICPMVYPSHYAQGTFGIPYPHLDAHGIIFKTMNKGQELINEKIHNSHKAIIRPWLQDFTLKNLEPYLKYGPNEIKAQIKGAYDAGLKEWLFWNAAGNYTAEGFK